AGLTPIRGWTGLLPVPGNNEKYEWSGFVPLEQLPRVFNPDDGWFATANNRTIPEDYKYKVGFEWTTYRVDRIRQVLSGFAAKQRKFRTEDAEELQNDVYSLPADQLIRMLPRRSDGSAARFLDMLKDWDCVLRSPSVPGALYEVWEGRLRAAILEKIAGPTAPEPAIHLNTQQALDYLKSTPA